MFPCIGLHAFAAVAVYLAQARCRWVVAVCRRRSSPRRHDLSSAPPPRPPTSASGEPASPGGPLSCRCTASTVSELCQMDREPRAPCVGLYPVGIATALQTPCCTAPSYAGWG